MTALSLLGSCPVGSAVYVILRINKDTFGSAGDRKLPFEAKRESVMAMQNWVKINQVEQPAMTDTGCETGRFYEIIL